MYSVIRRYIGLALVLLLVLTSQSMAVVRGAPGPAGQMELCTGTGPVMVYVDENGEPVGAPHFCPDYALSLLVHVADPEQTAQPVRNYRRLATVRADVQSTALFRPRTVARAPPFVA